MLLQMKRTCTEQNGIKSMLRTKSQYCTDVVLQVNMLLPQDLPEFTAGLAVKIFLSNNPQRCPFWKCTIIAKPHKQYNAMCYNGFNILCGTRQLTVFLILMNVCKLRFVQYTNTHAHIPSPSISPITLMRHVYLHGL